MIIVQESKCLSSKDILLKFAYVLDKTLKGFRGVRLDNQKVFCAPGPRTKYFKPFFLVVQ